MYQLGCYLIVYKYTQNTCISFKKLLCLLFYNVMTNIPNIYFLLALKKRFGQTHVVCSMPVGKNLINYVILPVWC